MITETFETHCFWWHSQVKTLRNKVFWVTARVFETENSLFVHFDISQSGMAGSSVFQNSEKPMFPGSIGRLKVTESEEHLPLPTSFFPDAQLQITTKIEAFQTGGNICNILEITFFRRRMKNFRTGHPTTHIISTHVISNHVSNHASWVLIMSGRTDRTPVPESRILSAEP